MSAFYHIFQGDLRINPLWPQNQERCDSCINEFRPADQTERGDLMIICGKCKRIAHAHCFENFQRHIPQRFIASHLPAHEQTQDYAICPNPECDAVGMMMNVTNEGHLAKPPVPAALTPDRIPSMQSRDRIASESYFCRLLLEAICGEQSVNKVRELLRNPKVQETSVLTNAVISRSLISIVGLVGEYRMDATEANSLIDLLLRANREPLSPITLSKPCRLATEYRHAGVRELFPIIQKLETLAKNPTHQPSFDNLPPLPDYRDSHIFETSWKNQDRNRYPEVLANERTRFTIDGDRRFYYNANWVLDKKMLVAQAPLAFEIAEFWRMAVVSNCSAIAMLVNPGDSSSEYWPAPGQEIEISSFIDRTASIKVRNISETTLDRVQGHNIKQRVFQVRIGNQEPHIITQFHLENWPDHGLVPAEVLGKFIQTLNRHNEKNPEKPLLVHCSAGLGRSGTLVAAMELNARYREGDDLQRLLFNVASEIRDPDRGRVGLIQHPGQYELSAKAVQWLRAQQ